VPVRALTSFLLTLCVAQSVANAQVQGCSDDADDVDGDFEVMPEDRAEGVARNAPIVVRYGSDIDLDALLASVAGELEAEAPVPCAGALACVLETERRAEPRVVEVDVDLDEHAIVLTPREPLAGDTEHTVLVVQPDLDIVARSASSFVTGARTDRDPPELGYDAQDVSVSVTELPPECLEPAGSRRVVLELPPATDDGDAESVTLEIVRVGDGLDDGEVRARAANRGDPVLVSFMLGPEEAAQRTCLVVRAYDALGRKADREPRLCFNPSTRPLFSSACAAARPGRDNSWGACAWFLLAAGLAKLARRRSTAVPAKRL
jgi:hypothetical protein